MKLADMLVIATGAADDGRVIAAAAALAARNNAHARVVTVLPDTVATLGGWGGLAGAYVDAAVLQQIVASDQEVRAHVAALVQKAASEAGIGFGPGSGARMSLEESRVASWLTVLRALPLADLAILGASAVDRGAALPTAFSDALMTGRAPVLVIRDDAPPLGGTAAIAWDGSLEAGRAVRAALPLLADADKVVILQDVEGLDPNEEGTADPALAAQYLARRGVSGVTVETVVDGGRGTSLLAAARERGANLLVAGAYGHARLGEWIFGGATRAFLEAPGGPHLLLAH